MSAYLLVDTRIHDPETYEQYKVAVVPLIERHGGKYLVRGGAIDPAETDLWTPTRLVLIRFPDRLSARAFLDDPDYAKVKPLRERSADCTLAIVDGI
jgi:uncharacterized protein (DUF1330 family)